MKTIARQFKKLHDFPLLSDDLPRARDQTPAIRSSRHDPYRHQSIFWDPADQARNPELAEVATNGVSDGKQPLPSGIGDQAIAWLAPFTNTVALDISGGGTCDNEVFFVSLPVPECDVWPQTQFLCYYPYLRAADFVMLISDSANAYLHPHRTNDIISRMSNAANSRTEEDIREMESEEFLEQLYMYVSSGRVPFAMDSVIDHIDRLLNDGLFAVCNKLIASTNLERVPSSIRRAFLMVTSPAKDKLPARATFFNEALRLLTLEKGDNTARRMLTPLA